MSITRTIALTLKSSSLLAQAVEAYADTYYSEKVRISASNDGIAVFYGESGEIVHDTVNQTVVKLTYRQAKALAADLKYHRSVTLVVTEDSISYTIEHAGDR